MNSAQQNTDSGGLERFSGQAAAWWDKKGPLQALHDINPLRLGYISRTSGISGRKILDAGCGGGILTEPLAAAGARVTGIDVSGPVLETAKDHARKAGLDIDYKQASPEEFAERSPGSFDIVACMELLEHVPAPGLVISACAGLVKPGGDVFFSTINRTLLSWLLVIFAAERIFGITEKGTHAYERFIKPDELNKWAENCGLILSGRTGFTYIPIVRRAWFCRSLAMNYIMHFKKVSEK
ncbi:MAG: bifunctional 2-polyprenyl-6-hydroxyphenol methylase/3-demethylubiquinol 3-O-methyltransferase UbiG [Desulfobacterales bacterium]